MNKSKQPQKYELIGMVLLCAVLLACLFVRCFVFSNYRVKQTSMKPTLMPEEIIWASKLKKPQYGDIVLVKKEGSPAPLVKRVVAFGGDKVWAEKTAQDSHEYYLCVKTFDGQVKRMTEESYDGKKVFLMSVDYDAGIIKNNDGEDATSEENAYVVPKNGLYCLGDNRLFSIDSRYYGAFDKSACVGVVVGKGMTLPIVIVSVLVAAIIVYAIFECRYSSKAMKEIACEKIEKTSEILSEIERQTNNDDSDKNQNEADKNQNAAGKSQNAAENGQAEYDSDKKDGGEEQGEKNDAT